MSRLSRALISCSDKTGLEPLAKALVAQGAEIIASSGTAAWLRERGIATKTVEDFTGLTSQLDGRVKTLHPKLHAAILAKRDDPAHVKALGPENLIDMVVVNLYPFERTVEKQGITLSDAIEDIDIGGVALIRGAAKNFSHVAVVCDPKQYPAVIASLRDNKGALPASLRRELAVSAFGLTSRYDAAIGTYLGASDGQAGGRDQAERASIELVRRQALRYGENPHQAGAWFDAQGGSPWGLATLQQLQGKELSYNNLLDIDAAYRCLLDFEEPACIVVKHGSQCGMAQQASALAAYERALACDSESAFGGIVGMNRPLDAALAGKLSETFLEVIVAPAVEPAAAALLGKKKNLRVVTMAWPSAAPAEGEWRQLSGGWLYQDRDALQPEERQPKAVSKRQPTDAERSDLWFAWKAVRHVKSNGIVIAKDGATLGIGQGQPSRVGSVRIAVDKAGAAAKGAVAASDAFFPFADGVTLLAKAGVRAVIHPGGSIRDAEVIEAADNAGMAMLLTGVRHFRH